MKVKPCDRSVQYGLDKPLLGEDKKLESLGRAIWYIECANKKIWFVDGGITSNIYYLPVPNLWQRIVGRALV